MAKESVSSSSNSRLELLVFENNWCAQCYTQRPIIKSLRTEYPEQIDVKTFNVEEKPKLSADYNIKSAPSIIVKKNGNVVERIPRFIDKEQLETIIRYYL
ncbi:thiol reductase thioredoxin [Limosilactobacillus reuteri]|uniref:Thioredoxin n=1 Tax=Limosilactobacillus reuteri TaxID=1598 RepID=A0A256SPS7_LIMRT|nr:MULTISPECIES: thioredoxin domain-containing protein [Limosilactobacillus]MCW3764595.1 thioredoxin family protein [Weissella confusa]MCC4381663.1 thioredoxin family protein [Limosilactobacillus reuteri]MCC4410779.1 thioredoxin family protein [Limosilactobacillus reuteri]MCR1863957.1 thioredoxin family protein [Limosilactobacillus reuteri]MCR1893733.1 thioredoxin family protein [Limosilactobacillus reuteri]